MEEAEIKRAIEAILFAAGDPVGVDRMAIAIGAGRDQIEENLKALMDAYSFERRGMRIIRLEDAYQMVSAQELSEVISRALETRKPPKLSASALETLTVIAYYQPTTKAFVEQIRGVDSSYTISALLNKKLIEEQGRLSVPGRPILYGTTPDFLRTFGIASLDDLPEVDLPKAQTQQLEMQLSIEDQQAMAESVEEPKS
ncbi:MAG: SMC-Scp complex subunit ScpB [Oscillospiraceae bacterium]|nr:SMC-Scp complex subunit ScpB [Oscillospiraceae bacterium]